MCQNPRPCDRLIDDSHDLTLAPFIDPFQGGELELHSGEHLSDVVVQFVCNVLSLIVLHRDEAQ